MNNSKRTAISYLFVFIAYSIFGFSFMFTRGALDAGATPFMLGAVRFTAALVILLAAILMGRIRINLKGKDLKWLLTLGFIQPFVYFIFETYGIAMSPTSFVGTMLALIPMVSLVMSAVFLKEKASKLQVVFALISVFGVFLTGMGSQSTGSFSWAGFLLLIGAVLCAAIFNILSRKLSDDFSAVERTLVMFILGAVSFGVCAIIENWGDLGAMLVPMQQGSFWVSILFLSGASSVGAFLMINYAMTYLDVAKASIFSNLTTVISILAGVLLLSEPFSLWQAIGSVIIIASVYFVSRPAKVPAEKK